MSAMGEPWRSGNGKDVLEKNNCEDIVYKQNN